MRFSTMIISALAVTSLGAMGAPAGEDDKKGGYDRDPKKTVTVTVTATADCHPTYTPTLPVEDKCKYYCIFPKWDCNNGNVRGISQKSGVEDCAGECSDNDDCKLTVSNSGFCYPKQNHDGKWWNYNHNDKSQLAIEGKCKDLEKECDDEKSWDKKKYHPDLFKQYHYEKQVCPPKRW